MSAREERKVEKMRLLCEIGGFAFAGLFVMFLVIDIAIIRVGKIRNNMEKSEDNNAT